MHSQSLSNTKLTLLFNANDKLCALLYKDFEYAEKNTNKNIFVQSDQAKYSKPIEVEVSLRHNEQNTKKSPNQVSNENFVALFLGIRFNCVFVNIMDET